MRAELEIFRALWDRETKRTESLLASLPGDQYDLQPDPAGRTLGLMVWHVAEAEVYTTMGIEQRAFRFPVKLPHIHHGQLTLLAGMAGGGTAEVYGKTGADAGRTRRVRAMRHLAELSLTQEYGGLCSESHLTSSMVEVKWFWFDTNPTSSHPTMMPPHIERPATVEPLHAIRHRGQRTLLTRMAGGVSAEADGKTRKQMLASLAGAAQ
ncbi:MAG: hypothetical protein ABJE47_21955 [bacterium]